MLNSTQRVCVLLLAAACATSACNRRTVVRQRTPVGEEPSEVTISSPETAKNQKSVVVTEPPAPAPTREVVVVRPSDPPMPPIEATRPVSPAPDYIWIPGAYDWRGSNWEWVPGHWEHPAQPTMVWESGRWESVPGGYVWKPGHWR